MTAEGDVPARSSHEGHSTAKLGVGLTLGGSTIASARPVR